MDDAEVEHAIVGHASASEAAVMGCQGFWPPLPRDAELQLD